MRRRLPALLLAVLLLTGCASARAPEKKAYQTVYFDAFDTLVTLRGYETSEEAFQTRAEALHGEMLRYHSLFDIYHDCPGGLKEVNDRAGTEPVQVAPEVMALLLDCRDFYERTGHRVNVAMGSVLRLWHEAREAGLEDPEHAALPDADALQAAAEHISFDTVLLDEENGTVFLTDPEQRLDVGAIAKGWTAQRLSETLPDGYLLNMGGNVCAIGSKPDGGRWNLGIQNPNPGEDYLCVVSLSDRCVVTSGDYQRAYTVDGKSYHHIIDPDTLMPSTLWRSVTILATDSGLADCLSTALFLMPLEEGVRLAAECGVEAMWYDAEGTTYRTEGFAALVSG